MSKQVSIPAQKKVFAFKMRKCRGQAWINVNFSLPDQIGKEYSIPDSEMKYDESASSTRLELFFKSLEQAGLSESVAFLIFVNFDDSAFAAWEYFLLSTHSEKLTNTQVMLQNESGGVVSVDGKNQHFLNKWNQRFSQNLEQNQIIPLLLPFWEKYFPSDTARIEQLKELKGYCFGLAAWREDFYEIYDCLTKLKMQELPDHTDREAVEKFAAPLIKLLDLQKSGELVSFRKFGLGNYSKKGLQSLCDRFLQISNPFFLNSYFRREDKTTIAGHAIFLSRLPNGNIALRDANLNRLRSIFSSSLISDEIIKQLGRFQSDYVIECEFQNPLYADSAKEMEFLPKHATASPLLFLRLVLGSEDRIISYLQMFPSPITTLIEVLRYSRQRARYYQMAQILAYVQDEEKNISKFCASSLNETDLPLLTFISERRRFRDITPQRILLIMRSVLAAAGGKFDPAQIKGIGFLGKVSPLIRLILTASQELSDFTDAIKLLLLAGFDINEKFEFRDFDAKKEKNYQGTLAHWFTQKNEDSLTASLASYGLDYKIADSKGCQADNYQQKIEIESPIPITHLTGRYAMVSEYYARMRITAPLKTSAHPQRYFC